MLLKISLKLLDIYQRHIRIMLPPSCRFTPSCSSYAREALVRYGLTKGMFKAAKRLLCCHPFSGESGYNPLI